MIAAISNQDDPSRKQNSSENTVSFSLSHRPETAFAAEDCNLQPNTRVFHGAHYSGDPHLLPLPSEMTVLLTSKGQEKETAQPQGQRDLYLNASPG